MMQNEKDDLLKKLKEKEIIGNKTNSWYVYNPMHILKNYNVNLVNFMLLL